MLYTQTTTERGGRRREVEEEDGGDGGDGATADQRAAPPHPPPLPSASRFQVRKVLRKRGGGGGDEETGRLRMRKEERRGVEDGERGGKFASFMHIFSLSRKLACHFCQRERERKEGHSPSHTCYVPYTYCLHVYGILLGVKHLTLSLLLSISPLPRFSTDVTAFFRKEGRGKKATAREK